jgi:hypothetical protein
MSPSIGGARDFINLIHNILEGGEKDRMNRAAVLRESKPISCWPLITGEDVPDHDPASLARILVVHMPWPHGKANDTLAEAQRLAPHLSAVGKTWLEWLESEEGQARAREAAELFPVFRAQWAAELWRIRPEMVNILRVSSNLASNELTWRVLMQHPTLGPLAKRYVDAHKAGLRVVGQAMAAYTAESLEAHRFLATLRELLVSERYLLLPKGQRVTDADHDRLLGWRDTNGVHLLSTVSREAVERTLGRETLSGISEKTLHMQLDNLGFIAGKAAGRLTRVVTMGAERVRVLHLTDAALLPRPLAEADEELRYDQGPR